LQLRATEILQNLLPIGRIIVPAQVGLQLATENLQSCTLSDTIRADQSQNLARTGHGQSMQLEAVGRVSMRDLSLEVRRQVDDVDGIEWAFLRADTTSYA
jgi:hypothetical protein